MDRHDRHHHRDARVGQDPAAWSASNDTARRMRARGSGHVTAAPDGSSWRRPEYCLESITNTPPWPIIRWSRLAQLPRSARSRRTTHPYRSKGLSSPAARRSPAAKRRRAGWAGPEPQLPAGRGGRQPAEDQSHPGRQQAAEDPAASTHSEDDGDPPEQRPGPARPLHRPLLALPSQQRRFARWTRPRPLRQSQQLTEPKAPTRQGNPRLSTRRTGLPHSLVGRFLLRLPSLSGLPPLRIAATAVVEGDSPWSRPRLVTAVGQRLAALAMPIVAGLGLLSLPN